MLESNYHIHSLYCDGHDSLDAMAAAARAAGLKSIGFSSHFTMDYPDDTGIDAAAIPAYLEHVARLKADYAGEMKIYSAFEMDYYMNTGAFSALARRVRPKLDYVIGSIHTMGYRPDGVMAIIDAGPEEFVRGVREIYGSGESFVQAYFKALADMARRERPEIIGHLDLIKKNNAGVYDENAPYYRCALTDALDTIAATPCIVEVNTGGLYRYGARCLYPSEWALAEIQKRGIPVTVNADTHFKDGIAWAYPEMEALLRETGFKTVMKKTADAFVPVPL